MKLMSSILNLAQRAFGLFEAQLSNRECRRLADMYDFRGFKRFYLIHIRKTGGTSLNHMFLALSGDDPKSLYHEIAKTRSRRVIRGDKVFVGWNQRLINRGAYFYAFSHLPLFRLGLPPNTFTLTCFRDPAERVISHYRMLKEYRDTGVNHPCMTVEGKWLGTGFRDFLSRVPREHLLNQVYMFSRSLDVSEAVENARKVTWRLFSDEFTAGVSRLNDYIDLNLKPIHIRKSNSDCDIDVEEMLELRRLLLPEYDFLNRVREQDN